MENQESSTNSSQITLSDIAMLVNLIDVCSSRGAFKGDELLTVGQLRVKLNQFVTENAPKEEKEEEKAE